MSSTLTPNMNLVVPTVGDQTGPAWASNINSDLSILDQHNHTAGNGVPIPAAALDINQDLSFNNTNSAIDLLSARFDPQSVPLAGGLDLGCLYVSGVDLYYNDVDGNPIRLTANGDIAGTNGSIGGLTPPATATYVALSETFIWESDTAKPANMDFGFAIFRNNTANSKGLTLAPPSAMAADYSVTLPPLPASQKIMTLDASGNMTAPYVVDNSTIEINSNTIRVKALGIGTSQIADSAVTTVKIADANVTTAKINTQAVTLAKMAPFTSDYSLSSSSGTFNTNSTSYTAVTNLSFVWTVPVASRPVFICIVPSGDDASSIGFAGGTTTLRITVDGSAVAYMNYSANASVVVAPPGFMAILLNPSAGDTTFAVSVKNDAGNSVFVTRCRLFVYQL